MKTSRFTLLAIAFLFGVGGRSVAQQRGGHEDDASKNGWLSNFEEGLKQADESGKPLMVVLRCVP